MKEMVEYMKIGKVTNVIILSFIWSVFLAAQGYANQMFSSFTTGVFMFVIAATLLLLRMIANKTAHMIFEVKPILSKLIIIGMVGFCTNIFSFFGFKYGNPQTGAFLLKTDVLIVSLLSAILYKEKFKKTDILCGLAMFGGVLLILDIDFSQMTFGGSDMLFVLSAFFLSINAFLIANVIKQQKVQVDSYTIAFYNAAIGAVLFSVAMVATGDIFSIKEGLSQPDIVISLIIVGLAQYFLYISYYRALRELPVWLVKVILLIVPIITMVMTYFLYGTIPGITAILGGVVVLISGFAILKNQAK